MSDLAELIADGRAMADEVLIDNGSITRDPDGTTDGTWDPVTFRATVPDDDLTVWTGPCLVTPETANAQAAAPGTAQRTGRFRVLLPHTAPLPDVGHWWTTTVSQDPTLVGLRMRVDELVQSTALVFRTFYVTRVVPA